MKIHDMVEPGRVRQARQTDLPDWLRRNNIPLVRAGQWWYIEGIDSLRIQGYKWFRNSQGIGGNAIDFLVHFFYLSQSEAVDRLTQDAGRSVNIKIGVKEKNKKILPFVPGLFDFNSIATTGDQRRVIAYLVKTRGIPVDIVLAEIRNGRLFQESLTGNAVFAMTNEYDVIVGAEVVGTLSFENSRFKSLKACCECGYGFSFGQKDKPRFILFFESAVDLLSFVALMRTRSKPMSACLLVSMAGLKFNVVQLSLRVFGNQETTPVFCVDNDVAANRFIDRCLSQYPSAILKQPVNIFKDWNDQLRGITL